MTAEAPRSASEMNAYVAEKIQRFKSVYIPYPRHTEFHERCDYLQKLGVQSRGLPQMGLRVLGPTGSGKTTAADRYIEIANRHRPKNAMQIPIVKVELERAATPRKLLTSILDAYGDPYAERGNELSLKMRAIACFVRFGTELLIVDEIQHLNYRSGPKNDVADMLKGLLDAGVVPIVFLGTEEATGLFRRNLQLNGRLLAPGDLTPLRVSFAGDQRLFAGFVAQLERVVVEQGVLPELSHLASMEMLPPLFEVSKGVVGRVSRLFQVALEIAIRRGASRLEPYDLALAVDRWAIPQGFVDQNPFGAVGHE